MVNRFVGRAFSSLQTHLKENVVRDKVLAKETTMRVGGPAAIFAVADSIEHLKIVFETAKEWGLPVFTIGKGSNLLVSDTGFPGIVLRLGKDFTHKRIDGGRIQAGAAVSLPSLVQTAAKHSLGGLEFAVGIPGSLGGAVVMNAGAHGGSIGDITKYVVIYTRHCEYKVLERNQIAFEYRKGNFDKDDIVVEAMLTLAPEDMDTIRNRMEECFSSRKKSQPLQYPSAGSIFKNPERKSAGKLIEEAGCKEMRIGDAQVSPKHANFIINLGRATASDVYALLQSVQQRVFDTYGIILEPEVEFLGEFDDALLAPKRN